jgi:hypothetical protein
MVTAKKHPPQHKQYTAAAHKIDYTFNFRSASLAWLRMNRENSDISITPPAFQDEAALLRHSPITETLQ